MRPGPTPAGPLDPIDQTARLIEDGHAIYARVPHGPAQGTCVRATALSCTAGRPALHPGINWATVSRPEGHRPFRARTFARMVPSCGLDAPEMSPLVHAHFIFPPYPRLTVDGHSGEQFPPAPEVHRLYDAEAVDRYVAALQQELADLETKLGEAKQLAQAAEQKMVEAERAQALLGRVWLTAQADIDAKLADAERQARYILADAQRQADAHIADTRMEAQSIINEAHETIEAVFAALTQRGEPERPLSQPTIDLTGTTGPAPAADLDLRSGSPASAAGPWATTVATDDASDEPLTGASAGDVGAQIVELSRIERRLHSLASRATSPVTPQRGDPASQRSGPAPQLADGRGSTEWPTYEPTGTDGGAVALAEVEGETSGDLPGEGSPPAPPAPLDEPLAVSPDPDGEQTEIPPAVSFESQWAAPSVDDRQQIGPPPEAAGRASAWTRPEWVGEQPQPPSIPQPGASPWSGLPPTASWSPSAPSLRPPTQWSSSPLEAQVCSATGPVADGVGAPDQVPTDSEAVRPLATVATWRERWRLARDGASALDDDMLSRLPTAWHRSKTAPTSVSFATRRDCRRLRRSTMSERPWNSCLHPKGRL